VGLKLSFTLEPMLAIGSSTSSEIGSGLRVLMTKIAEKNTAEFFLSFISKNASIKDVQATREAFSPKKTSCFKKMKFINSYVLWVIFALLDLDPDCEKCLHKGRPSYKRSLQP
jgi:hypothetical protein